MVNPIIKICGIRDPDMAENVAMAGANLIGIVFHPLSSRYVNVKQAIAISHATRKAGAKPVAIFVNHTESEMRSICEQTQIDIVQLHGKIARDHHHLLPDHYQRIYVQNVTGQGELHFDQGLQTLDVDRDLILIDHEKPGQGNSIYQSGFHYDLPFSWLLAGGLTADNVTAAIRDLQPNGVDVSSGVESSLGNKSIQLVREFINTVVPQLVRGTQRGY